MSGWRWEVTIAVYLSEWLGDLRSPDLLASCFSLSVVSYLDFPTRLLSDHDLKTYLSLSDRCLGISWAEGNIPKNMDWRDGNSRIFIHLFIHPFVYLLFYFCWSWSQSTGGWVPFSVKLNFSVVIFRSKLAYLKQFLVSSNSASVHSGRQSPTLNQTLFSQWPKREDLTSTVFKKSFTEYLMLLLNFTKPFSYWLQTPLTSMHLL